jgi:hypothetical protein
LKILKVLNNFEFFLFNLETVNHRKLANATSVISDIIEVVPEVVQTVTDITEVKGTDE